MCSSDLTGVQTCDGNRLEYEDENYVYYVRAIPKYSVARTDKKVTTITKAGDGETSEEDSFLDDDQSLDDYFRT